MTWGEVYDITEDTLDILDRIEGYRSTTPATSLYVRESVPVRFLADGQIQNVMTYVFNGDFKASDTWIRHGDYRRYVLEQKQENFWVIAYGSNMHRDRLEARVGPVSSYQTGTLPGFRLTFNKLASQSQHGYANVVYTGLDEHCPAMAYSLRPEQVNVLDQFEGVPNHYLRVSLPFETSAGERIWAHGYLAHPDRLRFDLRPTPDYLQYLQMGYDAQGWDQGYLDRAIHAEWNTKQIL